MIHKLEVFPQLLQFLLVSNIVFLFSLGHCHFLIESHVNRVGDKISVNIDLRLVDLQNLQKQQQQRKNDNPDWSGLDPLDRHIRKLERSIDNVRLVFNS
jgi:hypothetical protein